ncbi:MAG: pre-peptidase C-terminal domain-containing protein [Cyanobacteria bacterium J06626_23]
MVQVSLSTSTTFDGDLNALVEDQGTSLTVRFELDEPAPVGGLKVYIDSDVEQILNRLDLPGAIANPQFENLNLLGTQTNFDNSGLAVEITEGSTFATITLDIFDNVEPDTFLPETFDGLVEATLSLVTADQIAPEDQSSITGVDDYTIAPDADSSTILFADTADQLPGTASGYDEAISGDISNDPNNPLELPLAEGTTRLTAATGNGDQEYVTVTVPDGFQLDSITLESYSPNDVAFIGVQEGSVFTEPLDNSADVSGFLGYTLFGQSAVGTDILDNIGNGSNGPDFGGQGFEGPLPAGTYTFALQQLGPVSDYTLAFNVTEAAAVENIAPVATDDSYTVTIPGVEGVAVPTELTVNAAEGVLANDSDANEDDLTVAISTGPEDGNVTLNNNGSFTYTPTNGFTPDDPDGFTYTVSDGNGGSDTGSVTINTIAAPNPPPTGDPVVSFEVTPNTFSEEDPNNLVEWKWTVIGDFPDDGLVVNLNTSGGGFAFAFTEQFAADPPSEFINSDLVGFDPETGGLNVRLDAPEASFKLYFVDDILEEGTQEFEFLLVDGDGYTVNSDMNGGIFTITDDNGGPGVGPTVGLSVSETNLAEGDPLVVNFMVNGDIPAEGVQVLVQSDVPGSLGQFDLADLGNITTTGIEGLPTVGDGGGGSFFITITEPTATISLNVFDDIIAEEPLPITFSLANGELYEVDPNNGSTTLTISDEAQPAGPTVSISVDRTDLTEGGDPVTLTISVDGDIPEGGLPILINDVASAGSQVRSLTEFDIANVTTTGLAEFPTPADGDSGFFVTVTEPTATITLAAFDDGADEDEAAESFTFEVIDGEAYQVDADAGSVTLNIADADAGPTLPVVSLEAIPATISEEGSAEDRLFTLAFSVEGEIPEGGLVVLLENLFGITDQSDGEDDRGAFNGLGLAPPFDTENNIIGVRLLENEASIQLPIANDLIEETTTFDFQLLDGDGYTVDPDQGGTLFTITDDNGGPGVGPTIGLTVSETDLVEGDPLTVSFTVEGDIPAGGVDVLVQSPVRGVLGQFDLANLDALQLSGVSNVRPGDTFGQSFIATITEANASITLDIFNDIVAEEPIELPFTLANGELYEVDPAAASVTLTISDDVQAVGPTVGISLEKSSVVEGETITLTFNVEGDIPADGVTVLVNDNEGIRSLTEFDISGVQLSDGIEGFPIPADGDSGFFVTLTQATASITLPVLDDGADEDEAAESFTFGLIDGEAYEVDADAGSVTLDIIDVADAGGEPTVSFSTDITTLTESEGSIVTFSFDVSGTIPEGGLPVSLQIDADQLDWFFDFDNNSRPRTNAETGSFDEVLLLGGESTGIDGGRLIGTLTPPDFNTVEIVITENTASFQFEIFDDVFAEANEDITFTLLNGDGYEVAENSAPITLTLQDSPDGIIDGTSPVVGLAIDQTTVAEGESLTVTFTVEGDIPEGGLPVFVDSNAAGVLGEFNPDAVTFTGLAAPPGPDTDAGGFVALISESTATITLPVFKDGLGEGTETYTFNIVDGEAYDPDPAASEVTLTIEETPPVISVDVVGGVFEGSDLLTPNIVETPDAGTSVLSVVVQSDAPIPEDGLVVNINTDLADITEFVDGSNFVPTAFGGEVLGAIYDADGNATGLQVRMDAFNTVVNFVGGLGLEGEGPHNVTFSVEAGDDYLPASETASITVYDTIDQVPTVTDIPEIGISIAEQRRPLSEGSGAITLEFTVTGDIPPEGVIAYVSTGERAGLGDFDLLNAGVVGGTFPPPDGQAGGFYFKITEPTASITLQAAEDEEIEGIEDVNVSLLPLPGYTIADGAGTATALLRDGRGSEIQVSLAGSPEVLVEEDGTLAVHTFELSAPPPAEGITVTVIADATQGLVDFDLSGAQTTGLTDLQVAESFPEQITFTITEQTATISLPVTNDGVAEGLETIALTLAAPGEDADYQVNPVTNTATFTIVDTADQIPPEGISEDPRSSRDSIGDTIAEAQATGLSADNSNVTIEAAINGNFFNSDRTQTDSTEDVDMYSVDLSAGDMLSIDLDAQSISDDAPDTVLRVFDAAGNELASSDDDFAPDELFAPGRRDSYLEFTPDADGTYYIGVSSFGNGQFDFWTNDDGTFDNDFYDPNVAGSGAGRSDGPYTLNLSLNDASGVAATEIPMGTGEGPTVSISPTVATYDSSDNLIAPALVQYTPERRNASILTISLDVDGEIPEEGLETYITTNVDLSTLFSTSAPFSSEGVEVLGAVYDDAGAPVGLRVNLMTNSGFVNLNLADPEEAPTDGEETLTVTLAPAAGYTVGEDSFSAVIYDTLDDVPELPTVPTVSISVSETALIESEGNTTTLTFELNEAPPVGGLTINVDSGVRAALGEFDVFNAEIVGGAFPSPNFQASGFFFTMTEQTATITLAAFDETTNPEIPAEDALEGIDEFTFTVQPGAGYAVAPNSNAVTVTIADNPESVVIGEGNGEGGEGESDGLTETEFNDTIADAMVTGLSATNPIFEVSGEIDNSRATRNFVDATEDVDMYAFDLEAGQTVILDVDGGGTGSAGVPGSLLDNILRVFDADGNEVAINENGGAPDEVFQANGDAYLEFTAPETGTYYAGISNLGNNFYDPNVQASGSGWIFEDRFEPGPYRFTATLAGAVVDESGDTLSTNNDTIADAQVLDLSAENANIRVQAAFEQRFEDRSNTADATEDVDLFKVELQAGDVITVDADSVLVDFDGFPSGPAPDITIFDANGDRVVLGTDEDGEPIFAYSRQDGAPDEAFVAGRDGYIEFTAPETGTYYIGASQYRNDSYDANEVGSGSGAVFSPRFGVLAGGEYTLDIALNPTGFNGEVYEAFDGTPDADAPTVSFTTTGGTFARGDVLVSDQIIESEEAGTAVLDFTFSVDGEIPEGGLEVFVTSDTDMTTYFEGLSSNPRVAVGGEITGGLYNAAGELIGFKALLTASNARFPYNAAHREDDDPTMPETLTFSLASGPEYQVDDTTSVSEVVFYDDLAQVQSSGGPVPEVAISVDTTELIETEGTELTLTVNVTGEIPAEGLLIAMDGQVPGTEDSARGFLGEFDVFNAEVTGGPFPSPNGSASGFFFRVFENTATIKLQVFDETTNDQISPEDALEGVENFTFSVIASDAYTIDAAAGSVDITIKDNPDSVPLMPGGGEGGEGGMTDVVTDNDGRSTIDDTIETAVATGLSPNQTEVMVEGSIAVRWRNAAEQRADNTEDVDMYSFDLAAGETVTIDATSVPFELDGTTQVTAPTLRVFDASGQELAMSGSELGSAPVADPTLEFMAAEAGTYYVGVSQYLNDNYDPMVNASGDGVQLVDDGISPGEYTLTLTLDTDREAVPEVSLAITPDQVSEELPDNAFTATFTVDGEVPEAVFDADGNYVSGGLSVFLDVKEVAELGNQFDDFILDNLAFGPGVDGAPPSAFEFILFEETSSISLTMFDDIIEEEPFTFNFELIGDLDGMDYAVDPDANMGSFELVDGNGGPGVGPTVGLSISETALEEGDSLTVNFSVDREIPADGLQVVVASSTLRALGEFAIFDEDNNPAVELDGIAGFPEPYDGQGSSFLVTLTDPNASLTLSVFDDGANEGPETLDFTLLNGELYEVDANASSVMLTINDFETVGGDEDDTLVGDDADNSIAGLDGNDTIAGSEGNDIILGGEGDDVLRGAENSRDPQDGTDGGNDIIFGGGGNDRIGGKSGNDILSGDAGDDMIWGDDGDDILMGVTGNDILVGDNRSSGSGSDLFVFGNGDGTDTILDFEVGTDRIGLVDGELTFADLTLTQDGSSTLLGVTSTGETLAVLNNVQASALGESSFEVVPDVSNPDEALALI